MKKATERTSPEAEFLTVDELTALLKVSRATVYRMFNDRRRPLPYVRAGSRTRVSRVDLEAYLAREAS